MMRRSRERRAAAGEGGQAAARAAASPPHYNADEERRFAEEVLYLHSLWRRGPSAPAGDPAPPAGVSRATRARAGGSRDTRACADRRKRRRIERAAEPEDGGPDWSLAPAPTATASWPDSTPFSPAPRPQQQPSTASLAQRDALRAAEEFFSGRGASGDGGVGDDESEGSESEDGGDAAAGFFLGLFERDAALRGYYERSHEEGEFRCMGCVGRKRKGRRQARSFRDCKSLVHHARDATRCGRPLAHRALAAVVCRVLGWDVKRLPSIVIDPRGTLGQALLAREGEGAVGATAHEAKDNVDAGDNGHKDAAKEDVGLEKNGSLTDDKKEDVDSIMNEGPLSDGDAAKEDVDKGKIGFPSNNNDGEVHEQGNGTGTAEKEYDAVKAPAPAPARGSRARTDRPKRSRIERHAEPEEGPDSLLVPSPPATTSPASWADATPSSPASLAQQDALRAAKAFFSGRGALGEDDESVGAESEDGGGEAAGFFLGLFERDAALRGYYERNHGEGEFLCMVCVGTNVKRARTRRFRDCASLVGHARAVTRRESLLAHRALTTVVCRVLGWDIKWLPRIVIDPRGTLGQALLAREVEGATAATAQEAKGNVGTVDNDVADAVKGDVGLEKNGSLNDHKEEDVDSIMNDAPLCDGNAAKDDVAAGKISPPSKDNGGEVHEQENDTRTVEKEGAIGNKQEHPKSADDMGGTCNARLENNSSKQEGSTENKEEHTDGVVDSGDGTGNLGNNLMDSSKS